MEPDMQVGTVRFRFYNWLGLVLGVLLIVTGILAVVIDGMAFGWGFIAGGVIAAIAGLYQLGRR